MAAKISGVPHLIPHRIHINGNDTGQIQLRVRGMTGQTANIVEVQNVAGTTLFSVNNDGDVSITGDLDAVVNETLTGNIVLSGNLTVNGNTTIGNAVGDTLTVTATSTFQNPVTMDGTLDVTGILETQSHINTINVTLRRRGSTPATIGSAGRVYTFEGDADTTELFYLDAAGNAVQITDAGALEGASLFWDDDEYIRMGNVAATPDVRMGWNTTQTVDAWYFGTADGQNVLLIAENGDRAFDFAHGAQGDPTVFIHSATQNTTQWLSLTHNAVNGVIATGTGNIIFSPNAGNIVISQAAIGGIIGSNFSNTDDTNGASHGRVRIATGGNSGGDAYIELAVGAGPTTWVAGLDNSDSDAFVFSVGDTIGTTNMLRFLGVQTTGAPTTVTITRPANTGITAATESIGIDFDNDATQTWAAGAGPLATQREIIFRAPTYAGNAGGALTITEAATIAIIDAPIQGANMTLSESHALLIMAGSSAFGGNVQPRVTDGAALGTSAIQWSDLFLASAGVINFAGGDVTITHAVNDIQFAGALGYAFDTGFKITETADHPVAPSAGVGQLWVRNDIPNVLVFTDDAGTDTVVGGAASWASVLAVGNTSGANNAIMNDDQAMIFGDSSEALLVWETADGDATMLQLSLPDGGAINVPIFAIGNASLFGKNIGAAGFNFAGTVDPTFVVFAADEIDYMSLDHNGTQATIATNDGPIAFEFTGGAAPEIKIESAIATESPKLSFYQTVTERAFIQYNDTGDLLDISVAAGSGIRFLPNNNILLTITSSDTITWYPSGTSSGSVSTWSFVRGADTGVTAATEKIGWDLDFSATKTWAAGAGPLATQRETIFRAPTYIGNAGGALTITQAATVAITGPPIQGANMTLSSTDALWLQSGMLRMDNAIHWDTGVAIVAGDYAIGRDADGTNQLHLNVPTAATMEFSVNDAAVWTSGASVITTAANTDINMSAGGRLYGGGIQFNKQDLAANTNLTLDENDGDVNVTTGAVSDNTITLPAATGNEGQIISVYMVTDGGNNAVLTRAGADVIQNGSADLANTTVTLNDVGDFVMVKCVNGSMWQIVVNSGGVVN